MSSAGNLSSSQVDNTCQIGKNSSSVLRPVKKGKDNDQQADIVLYSFGTFSDIRHVDPLSRYAISLCISRRRFNIPLICLTHI